MIDLHCHLLPAIDDGPADDAEAIALAGQLYDAGVRTVAATPHLRDDHPGVVAEEIAPRCSELAESITTAGIDLNIVPAAELDFVRALEASDELLRLASYGGRGKDILLETPYGPLPTSFEEQVFRLSVRGYRILLAHPERNPTLQSDPDRLYELVRRGVLLQITAGALVPGRARSRSTDIARSLVSERVVHVLASDAHGARGPSRLSLDAGVAEARMLVGPYADWMVEDAPAAVLAGEPLPTAPETGHRGRRSLLARLWRH